MPDGSDLATVIAVLTTGLTARNDNTDRARSSLTAYRDALAARQAADRRDPTEGNTAHPAIRPPCRRVTASPPF